MRHRVIAFSAALVTVVVTTAFPADAMVGPPDVPGNGSSNTAVVATSPVSTSHTARMVTAATGDDHEPTAPHGTARRAQRTAALSRSAARRATTDDADPLTITLDAVTPSAIPARGVIEVSGTVINTDAATWTTVKVYPFVSDKPMTTEAELDAATQSGPDAVVGGRVGVETDHNATIDTLAPGEQAHFDFTVPRGLLGANTSGVYWFGVQALGQGPDGRDLESDGRAYTFLPLVPQRATGSLPVSVVLPLRRPIGYAEDGSLADPAGWLQTLSDRGRLRSLVDLGGSAGGAPVSWLVDPALVDAVRRLAAGNPGRSLAPNLTPGLSTDPDATPSNNPDPGSSDAPASPPASDPASDPSTASDADGGADEDAATDGEPTPLTQAQLGRVDASTRAVAVAAQDWLTRLRNAIRPGDELLVLPYGDTDVSGAADHAPRVYQVARARADAATVIPIPGLGGVQVTPAVDSPSGYLSTAAVGLIDPGTTAVVTDQMFDDAPGTVATVSGRNLVVSSSAAAAAGEPGPGESTTTAMRQRLLAEAAVRFLGADPQPLVMVLPHDLNPRDATGFFSGLDVAWAKVSTVAEAAAAADPTVVDAAQLRYPNSQESAELGPSSFDAAARLMAAGVSLQSLLTLNNLVSGTVRDEALVSTSYSARTHPDATRVGTDQATSWIAARTRRVTVSAPTAVNLLSSTGQFNTTIRNGLDQPVTVELDARTDGGLRVTGPRRIRVPAGAIASVPLGARTDKTGVHRVMLRVTDQRGVALGSTAELSVRSSQVSGIIWLFLAIGAVLLFGTIAVRLFRRVRDARRGRAPAEPGQQAEPAEEQLPSAEANPAGAGRR